MTTHDLLVVLASLAGGTIASLAGFGIGSIVTPLLAARYGMKLAVAVVAIPHVIGTAVRFWFLRHDLDRRVLFSFGAASAIGGLTGAVLHYWVASRALQYLLAALLIFAGAMSLFGITLRFGRRAALAAGALSGVLGGLVGNQGGIRAGAMLGFDVRKEAFVATSTAVALLIDGMRVPVYLWTTGRELLTVAPLVVVSTVAVVAGTLLGRLILGRVSEAVFRRLVGALILGLGISLIFV